MTVNQNEIADWVGHTLVDEQGDKIGKIVDLYVDEATGQPEWIAVKTGWFGSNISFVPIAGARPSGDDLMAPCPGDKVKDAPNATPDGHLTQEEEADLYRALRHGVRRGPVSHRSPAGRRRTAAGQGPRPTAAGQGPRRGGDSDDDAMTRSEEELQVGKQSREAGRARLRKYVVTEQQTRTVPVKREEVRVEREPITDANVDEATSGADISESEHEVVLHEEEPVVSKQTVPKERVRLEKDTVTDEREVTEEVRKERIEAEDETEGKKRR